MELYESLAGYGFNPIYFVIVTLKQRYLPSERARVVYFGVGKLVVPDGGGFKFNPMVQRVVFEAFELEMIILV